MTSLNKGYRWELPLREIFTNRNRRRSLSRLESLLGDLQGRSVAAASGALELLNHVADARGRRTWPTWVAPRPRPAAPAAAGRTAAAAGRGIRHLCRYSSVVVGLDASPASVTSL